MEGVGELRGIEKTSASARKEGARFSVGGWRGRQFASWVGRDRIFHRMSRTGRVEWSWPGNWGEAGGQGASWFNSLSHIVETIESGHRVSRWRGG
jgi:hypothetical protein